MFATRRSSRSSRVAERLHRDRPRRRLLVPSLLLLLLLLLILAPPLDAAPQPAAGGLPQVMFILDGSGSMWGQVNGQTKIEAAREVMARVVPALPAPIKVGLTVYGHRRQGDCADIETVIGNGRDDRAALLAAVGAVEPRGKTPIAAAVRQVAEALRGAPGGATTIVLISDGKETCDADPCGVVRALAESGVEFVLHVVGFDVNAEERQQLECLAGAGHGRYMAAADAATLLAALETVRVEVEEQVQQATTTKRAAATGLGKLALSMPAGAVSSLAAVELLRAADGKVVRTIEKPVAAATYPLLAGDYELRLAFANPNYRPPDRAPGIPFQITGGAITELPLGAIAFNAAREFASTAMVGISLVEASAGQPFVTHLARDNDYYLLKTRPVPPGTYRVSYLYGRDPVAAVLADGLEVVAGKTAQVDLNTGIRLERSGAGVTGWDLVPGGAQQPLLAVRRRRDNDYPLWRLFPLPAGTYDLRVLLEGATEPLPVADGIEIAAGKLLEFDTGL